MRAQIGIDLETLEGTHVPIQATTPAICGGTAEEMIH